MHICYTAQTIGESKPPMLHPSIVVVHACSPGGDVEEDTSAAMSEANTSLVPEQVGMLAPNGRVQLWTTGIPIRCPGGTWTEEEGAKTVDECGECKQTPDSTDRASTLPHIPGKTGR